MIKSRLIIILIVIFLGGCGTPTDQGITNETHNKGKEIHESNEHNPSSSLEVHFIDVGQGDSTLFRFSDNGEEHALLIDAGDFNKDDVIQYLTDLGVKKIDIAIGTHPDADHIGQMADVLKNFHVAEIWLPGNTSDSDTFIELLMTIDELDVGYNEPRLGEQYEIGPLAIDVLYPDEITGKSNDESISVKVTYGEIQFIFTGDASIASEREMILKGVDVKGEILHLGHHGSDTSTSEEFLQAVQPEVAIYSAGKDNSYGHPSEEIVARVKKNGIQLYGTDIHGTIVVTTDGESFHIKTEHEGTISEQPTLTEDKKGQGIGEKNEDCIDLNNASIEELEEIVHIGRERAEEIKKLRPYSSVDELSRINGIGPARLDDIKEEGLACVGGS